MKLRNALAVHDASPAAGIADDLPCEFDDTEVIIRDAFDALFAFLENVQYAVELGVLK